MFDVISALTGLKRATVTLSERHINGYDAHADPNPAPHKDRYPSQISVGLSIQIPADSQLVMYPFDHLERNPFNTAAELCESLAPEQKPEIVTGSAREVVIDDQDGDVVVFYGNKTWHLRRNSADFYNLYLKSRGLEDTTLTPSQFAVLRLLSGDCDVASLSDSVEPGGSSEVADACVRWPAPASSISSTRRSTPIRSFRASEAREWSPEHSA